MNKLYNIIIVFLLLSCSTQERTNECDFPEIVIETESDTVKIGEIYRAKISLSDTALLYLYDAHSGRKIRTVPLFWINDELVDSNEDFYIYETEVDSSNINIQQDGTRFKEWSIGLAFPHPSGFGDVKLSERRSYLIEK